MRRSSIGAPVRSEKPIDLIVTKCWTDAEIPCILSSMVETSCEKQRLQLPGVVLELFTRGSGSPLLFLHAENGLRMSDPWADEVASRFHLLAASHPGFGAGELPRWISTVDDLAYVYLDLLEA